MGLVQRVQVIWIWFLGSSSFLHPSLDQPHNTKKKLGERNKNKSQEVVYVESGRKWQSVWVSGEERRKGKALMVIYMSASELFVLLSKQSESPSSLPRVFRSCAHRAEIGQWAKKHWNELWVWQHAFQMSKDTLLFEYFDKGLSTKRWIRKLKKKKKKRDANRSRRSNYISSFCTWVYLLHRHGHDKCPVLMRLPSQVPSHWRNFLWAVTQS